VDFQSVWSGLEPICNYFWKPRALLEFLQTSEDHDEICNKYRGFGVRFVVLSKFPNLLATEKSVDRVHNAMDWRRGRVHGGPTSGTDNVHDGASPAHGY
jgi:hypothetical protein